MATTYTLIDKTTLGSSASSITFSSIPSTYTDLQVLISARTTESSVNSTIYLQVGNGSVDTGSNYSGKLLYGNGSSAASASYSPFASLPFGEINGANSTANTFSNNSVYIPNYSSSNSKSFSFDNVQETNATTAYASLFAGLWSGTSVINILKFSSDFASGTSIYLYGIKNS